MISGLEDFFAGIIGPPLFKYLGVQTKNWWPEHVRKLYHMWDGRTIKNPLGPKGSRPQEPGQGEAPGLHEYIIVI